MSGMKLKPSDLMLRLGKDALQQIRRYFYDRSDSLNLTQFVQAMLRKLPPHLIEENGREKVAGLAVELFEQVDVNGDGDMQWDEFTGFCVELGMMTGTKKRLLQVNYAVDRKYVDMSSSGEYISSLKWDPFLDKMLVLEALSPHIKYYDHQLRLTEVFTPPTSTGLDQNLLDGKIETIAVQWIAEREAIAVATVDLRLTLYAMNPKIKKRVCKVKMRTKTPQYCLAWSKAASTLFSSGKDGVIWCWDLEKGRPKAELPRHKGEVAHLLCVENIHKLLVSGGEDGRIILWDLLNPKFQMRGELKLHQKPIRGLVYCRQQDMLLSAAFEEEGVGWDLSTRVSQMKLKGHRMPLIAVDLTIYAAVERAVTLDLGGCFKMWDIRSGLTGTAICLQSFQGRTVVGWIKPLLFKCTAPHAQIVASNNKLHKFGCSVVHMTAYVPSVAIYNPVSRTILTAAGCHVRIWDAVSGEIRDDFFNISSSTITSAILDDRKRKFILGNTEGQVRTYNYTNGIMMKQATDAHRSDVVAMQYIHDDRLVVSVGWDGKMAVFDEELQESMLSLRTIDHLHLRDRDVSAMAASRKLALVATGAADFSVRVFDLQFCRIVAELNGHRAEARRIQKYA